MSKNLTFDELNEIFSKVTFMIKDLDYESKDQNIQKLVRGMYFEDSQPFSNIKDDTTYYWISIRESPTNDRYEKEKEILQTFDDNGDLIDEKIKTTTGQNMMVEVTFIFYGHNAFDSAPVARINLLRQSIYEFLKQYEIYLNREISSVRTAFEDIQGRWWKRADFTALYDFSVTVHEEINTIKSVPVDTTSINVVNNIIIKED